jgi:hypothetical protein
VAAEAKSDVVAVDVVVVAVAAVVAVVDFSVLLYRLALLQVCIHVLDMVYLCNAQIRFISILF